MGLCFKVPLTRIHFLMSTKKNTITQIQLYPLTKSEAISSPKRWCCESVALNMPANLENSAVARGLEKISFHSNTSKVMLKILQARLKQYVNRELPDVQPVLEKAEEPEIKLPTSSGSLKKQENSRKTFISALFTMPRPLTVWITTNCGKFWKGWEYQTTWPASWETCMQVRKQQLEPDME